MENVQIQPEIDTRSLLQNMAQMPVIELEKFIHEVNALIRRKKTQDKDYRERVLLEKISQTVLDKKKIDRHHVLVEKLEADTLTESEHTEFMDIANHEEKLRNKRVKYLIELAQLRAISLPQLMENLGLIPVNHG
jgi:hypothetical protein